MRMTKPHSAFVLFLITLLWIASPAAAQWSGSIGVAAAARQVSGSDASFRSQANLRSGFALDELTLKDGNRFSLSASGFGNAEPSQTARFDYHFKSPLTLTLAYDRRDAFFSLADATRSDDWYVARYNARAVWDGWKAGVFSLDLRQMQRGGSSIRPYFGLNEQYPVLFGLHDTQREATLRFDTRGYPFRFGVEQTFSRFTRRDRLTPFGGNAIGSDPDTLIGASSLQNDRQNTPTTRFVLSTLSSDRVEAVIGGIWTPMRLRATGPVTTTFGINGGNTGSVAFIDDVTSSASRDVIAGNARVAVRLAPQWLVRFSGNYRDSSTDATLLGTRLIRMINPQGAQMELTTPLGTTLPRSLFDFTDGNARLEIERRGEHLTLNAGGIASERTVAGIHRRSSGLTAGVAWRATKWNGAADFEHGTFEKYIFRTDPDKVDRLKLRGGIAIRPTLQLQADGRFERGSNPSSIAALNHHANFGALDLVWFPKGSDASAGFNISSTQLRTRTDLVLPGNIPGLSEYNLSLLAATAHARYAPGRYAFSGSLTRTRDHGSTWPLNAWNADARATVRLTKHFDAGIFGNYWSYNERLASVDDFNATRYGVLLVWRFE